MTNNDDISIEALRAEWRGTLGETLVSNLPHKGWRFDIYLEPDQTPEAPEGNLGLVVEANRAGITLGTSSLWGIESDPGDDYLINTVIDHGLLEEAMVDGEAKLAEIIIESPIHKAMVALLRWSCGPNKQNNPYSYEEIKEAFRALGLDWQKVEIHADLEPDDPASAYPKRVP